MVARNKPASSRPAGTEVRAKRATILVTPTEHERLTELAHAAGQSVSLYVRDRAFGQPESEAEQAALAAIDTMVGQMEGELDGAIAAVQAALQRMER